MSTPAITTGVDGVIASGNVPTWIIQEDAVETPMTDKTTSIPASLLSAPTTVKADCYHNMGGVNFTRTPTTRDRKRACEKVTVTVRTGQTIEGTIEAVYDQQAEDGDKVNAVYDATPEQSTIYVAIAYGHDSTSPEVPKKVDIYRGDVQTRAKNQPVEGEDLMYTATLSADLYLEDVTVTADAG